MKPLIPLTVLLTLTACGGHVQAPSSEPIIVPNDVAVPIAGACVPSDLKSPPVYVDSDAALSAAKDAAERYQLLWAGHYQRRDRLNEIEPIVAACPRKK